jgi:peptidoglycan/LPS O-acetylase OafA/YrhL
VVAYHAGTFTGLTAGRGASTEGVGPWVQHLNVGVSVFFVLSAFLLFRPFVAAHLSDEPGPAVRPYLVRRLVRIFPAYWLALTVSASVLGLAELGDWWGHLRFYALLQVYWGDTALGGLVQAWSLCTELSFYLFLPVWAALMARVGGDPARRVRAHYLGCVGLYVVGVGFRWYLRAGDHAIGYAWLPANTDLFALGMALAVASAASASTGRPVPGLLRTLGDLPGVAWVAALCCYSAVVSLRYPFGLAVPTVFQELARQGLFGVVAALVVAPGAFGPQARGLVRRALRSRPLHALGVVSYGIYLWHLMVLEELDPRLTPDPDPGGVLREANWWALTLTTVAIAVAVAAASWFVLERPLLRRVRRRPPGDGVVAEPGAEPPML